MLIIFGRNNSTYCHNRQPRFLIKSPSITVSWLLRYHSLGHLEHAYTFFKKKLKIHEYMLNLFMCSDAGGGWIGLTSCASSIFKGLESELLAECKIYVWYLGLYLLDLGDSLFGDFCFVFLMRHHMHLRYYCRASLDVSLWSRYPHPWWRLHFIYCIWTNHFLL